MIRNTISSVWHALILVFLTPPLPAADYSALYDNINESVVVLHTHSTKPTLKSASGEIDKVGLGSGVIVSRDGKILTAAHIVHTADAVHVELANGQRILARVIGSAPPADLALLQLEEVPDNLKAVRLGDSDRVKIGNEVVVIGAPYGYSHALSVGHISARHPAESLKDVFFQGEFFQTDAAINRGNSGGPMFNRQGEVIGIVSHIDSKSGGNEGLGFAMASNTARELLLEGNAFWTGIDAIPMSPILADAINYPLEHGALIQHIAYHSPLGQAGMQGGSLPIRVGDDELLLGGDIIVAVESIPIVDRESFREIMSRLNEIKPGEQIFIEYFRDGSMMTLTVIR